MVATLPQAEHPPVDFRSIQALRFRTLLEPRPVEQRLRLLDRRVLDYLEVVPLPGRGYQLCYHRRRFATVHACDFDGPALARMLERLQVYPLR